MLHSPNRLVKTGFLAASALVLTPLLSAQTSDRTPAPLTREQILNELAPRMRDVILLYDAIKGTPIVNLTPQDARQQLSAEDAAKILSRGIGPAEGPMPVGSVVDGLTIDGPDGNQIPIRIYAPEGEGPFPVTLYFHGGGFVIATIDTYDASARSLCNYSKSIVVSVEYRKAPEAPVPAARRDAIASYKWVINNIGRYEGNSRKVAVAGESAGGNLATEVAIAARDQDLQRPTHQLLIYPVASSNVRQRSNYLYTNSTLPLTTAGLEYFFKQYVTNPSEADDPDVSPINAKLKDLPPTTIIAAEFDPLLSDGKAYADALFAAGNHVDYRLYHGTTHEFFGMGAFVDKAKDAEMFGGSQLAASFR